MYRRIALIGGGAASASLLSELLRRAPAPLQLDWYIGAGQPGRGVAYATASDRHLLNVRAASMGMFAGKPRGFLDYVQHDDPTISGTDFLPRRRYGDYLAAEAAQAIALGRTRGHGVQLLPLRVEAMVPEADGVTVLHAGGSRRVDAAVLAVGALPPRPLAAVDTDALASGRYVLDPWPFLAAPPLRAPAHVIVLGLGLTAADVMVELAARWPRTHFSALSRHGQLPEPHLPAAALPLSDGSALVQAMLDAPDTRRWLRLLREAAGQEDDWRCTIDSLRPHSPVLWATLPPEQRARLLRHARWAWERARHRMPVPIAARMAELERSGRLQRLRGRVHRVTTEGDGLRLDGRAGDGQAHTLHADYVVQACGLEFDVARTIDPLLHQLVLNRHVLPDPLGLGCQATPQGRLLHEGGAWPQLFAIGSLMRGTLWESTAMPEIRQQARSVADQLLADATARPHEPDR